ncbi:hypothetical protein GJW-30_1_03229 [Variibacter gotjawalensis]|uniref:Uncharacterized protein n=1 Tax=Variibacter gotjawalensis TaxID=1333996 RepID=A0A0S3PXK2_9BRAD|nr:hypothetical protein [Variibacter gotjawalensis]NIK46513.1 hypothetical protein [Variibacter gotjawalensis]RZS48421.1 hypothetical protein EV661_0833 [Variibacter gotjawalensis]BAT60680.1 hypothetical protein GJW-30_1_03229 [Variibacter gotjawalensis]
MQSVMIQCAGGLAMLVAVIHGIVSETRVFASATVEPARWRRLVHLVWHASTVDWLAYGALLVATPMLLPASARPALVIVGVIIYGYAAAANAIATNGKHFGWMLLAVVVALLLGSLFV